MGIRDKPMAPTKWSLAHITQVHPGQDGKVRVVTLETAKATYTRPAIRIVHIVLRTSLLHIRGCTVLHILTFDMLYNTFCITHLLLFCIFVAFCIIVGRSAWPAVCLHVHC